MRLDHWASSWAVTVLFFLLLCSSLGGHVEPHEWHCLCRWDVACQCVGICCTMLQSPFGDFVITHPCYFSNESECEACMMKSWIWISLPHSRCACCSHVYQLLGLDTNSKTKKLCLEENRKCTKLTAVCLIICTNWNFTWLNMQTDRNLWSRTVA